jgi:hypothetical protein
MVSCVSSNVLTAVLQVSFIREQCSEAGCDSWSVEDFVHWFAPTFGFLTVQNPAYQVHPLHQIVTNAADQYVHAIITEDLLPQLTNDQLKLVKQRLSEKKKVPRKRRGPPV